MSDSQKVLFGCESKTTFLWTVGKYKLDRCPIVSITDARIFNYITAYNRYNKGFLPNEGGWLEQPYKFIAIIDIIEGEQVKIDEAKKKDGAKT